MDKPGGTVSYVADLALGLKKNGFAVEIFTFKIGSIAFDLQKAGINVVNNLDHLKNIPAIIHSHHNPTTMAVLKKFVNTPVIFFLHDKTSPFDKPFKHKRIIKFIAVDYNCLDRLLNEGKIAPQHTKVIYNWVDTEKFKLRNNFVEKPLKALVFSNYATKQNHYLTIAAACKKAGLQLDAIGEGMGTAVKNPEDFLLQYDLIFAKAKAAIEAVATGAGVIVCDYAGMGEMVSQANITYLRKYNFGRKTLNKKYDAELLETEIKKFSSTQNRLNAVMIREYASFEKTLQEIILLYNEVIQKFNKGEMGFTSNPIKNNINSFLLKSYFFFTQTIVFNQLSKLKYKIKNKLKIIKVRVKP